MSRNRPIRNYVIVNIGGNYFRVPRSKAAQVAIALQELVEVEWNNNSYKDKTKYISAILIDFAPPIFELLEIEKSPNEGANEVRTTDEDDIPF